MSIENYLNYIEGAIEEYRLELYEMADDLGVFDDVDEEDLEAYERKFEAWLMTYDKEDMFFWLISRGAIDDAEEDEFSDLLMELSEEDY